MNRQWRLRTPIAPEVMVSAEHFDFTESAIPIIGDNEILVRTLYLGTSPAQRGYITSSASMHNKVHAGEVMQGRGVGVVIETRSANYQNGDIVVCGCGWQDYSVHDGEAEGMFAPIKWNLPIQPYSMALSILGSAAYAAYFGLIEIGEVSAGDTVVVSAGAGGVGSCAVQIAKALGCRVVAVAGGDVKCSWLRETLGVDVAIDYKVGDFNAALRAACPDGVDVFFDNVGGAQLDCVLNNLALGARIVICGYIATDYRRSSFGPQNYVNLLSRRARMEGFFVFDYHQRFSEADAKLRDWYEQGLLLDTSDVMQGLECMPLALRSLFEGTNQGVRVCQLVPDSSYDELTKD